MPTAPPLVLLEDHVNIAVELLVQTMKLSLDYNIGVVSESRLRQGDLLDVLPPIYSRSSERRENFLLCARECTSVWCTRSNMVLFVYVFVRACCLRLLALLNATGRQRTAFSRIDCLLSGCIYCSAQFHYDIKAVTAMKISATCVGGWGVRLYCSSTPARA